MRKEELEQIVMTGKIQVMKARGRQRQMMLPSMAEDYAMKTNDIASNVSNEDPNLYNLYRGPKAHIFGCSQSLYLHLYCRIAMSKGNN